MPTSAIDSLIFRNRFGDIEVRQIWSDEYRTQCYLDWEAALARAQAGLGLIPHDAATEITRFCKVENIEFANRRSVATKHMILSTPFAAKRWSRIGRWRTCSPSSRRSRRTSLGTRFKH